jgi:hypothetical protein
MFSFFNNNKVEEEEQEQEQDNEEDSLDEKTDHHPFLTKKNLIFKDKFKEIYACDTQDFIPNITMFSGQRPVNDEHVESLMNTLQNGKDFWGTMKVVKDTNDEIRLIDGQHRFHAYRKSMENDPIFQRNLIIEVYNTDDIGSEKTIEIFKEVNNCRNLDYIPTVDEMNVTHKIQQRFPDMIIETKEIKKRVNRPRISKQELHIQIKRMISSIKEKKTTNEININEIADAIFNKNNEYRMKPRNFYPKISNNTYDKSKKSGFYIGLSDKFQWIDEIVKDYK